MALRTIMIFPELANMEVIYKVRDQYDPLSGLLQPHITLVFPFDSDMSNEQLKLLLANKLNKVTSFDIELSGISKQADRFGNYLFLNITKGGKELCNIHDILYADELKEFDLGLPYLPHMTIGNLKTVPLLDDAYNQTKGITDTFSTIIEKISVEMIDENEKSIIVMEKDLVRYI